MPDSAGYPPQWARTMHSGEGKLVLSSKGQVVKYELNVELDLDQFELEFPERYLVYDAIANEEYIVRKGGEKRPVLLEERARDITVDDLMTSEPGQAGLSRESSVNWLWLGVVIVVVITATCAVIIRARRRAA